MTVHAPFNFVPLSSWVYEPAWAPYVSHDVPFADGYSGALEIEITAETPLLIGGDRKKVNGPTEVHPFKLGEDYAIPPSSLQGCIRSVVEIASFSRFHLVDDRRFGVRDLTDAGKEIYRSRLFNNRGEDPQKLVPRMRAGWLRRTTSGEIRLTPCRLARVHVDQLFSNTPQDWQRADPEQLMRLKNDAPKRFGLWGNLREIELFIDAPKLHSHQKGQIKIEYARAFAPRAGQVTHKGYVVFTGKPQGDWNKAQKRYVYDGKKTYEFFFYDRESADRPVTPKDFEDFRLIHEPTDGREQHPSWKYFKSRFMEGRDIPVFWLPGVDGKTPAAISMAYMPKIAHTNSTHDLIDHTSRMHLARRSIDRNATASPAGADMATLLFGLPAQADDAAGQDKRRPRLPPGLKGRAAFDFALPSKGASIQVWHANGIEAILASPKPSFVPIYVRQHGDGDRVDERGYAHYTPTDGKHENPELAGSKRYPVRPYQTFPEIPANLSQSVRTKLFPLLANSKFTTKLRFHNLRPVELGALVWAITWGNSSQHFHALGMGKPLGLGRVSMRITGASIVPNKRNERIEKAESLSWVKRQAETFADHMASQYKTRSSETKRDGEQGKSWAESVQIRSLLAMADPSKAVGKELTYMRLTTSPRINEFLDAKNAEKYLPPYIEG